MFADQENIEEEEFVLPPQPTLEFVFQPQLKVTCDLLHIAFYGVSSLFASTLVDTQAVVSQLNFQRSKQKSLASVYKNVVGDQTQFYIIFNEQFEKMKQIHFAQFLAKHFEFKNLYIYTNVARGLIEKDDGKKLKYLQNSWGLDLKGPEYNQGIAGPEADLLQWCEINCINAICFIGIYSDYELNREKVNQIFGTLTQMLPLQSKFDISKQIKAYNMKKYSNKLYL